MKLEALFGSAPPQVLAHDVHAKPIAELLVAQATA